MTFVAALLWAVRSVFGLFIASAAALLAYIGLGLATLPARMSSDVIPNWLTSNLGPSLALILMSAVFIKARLWTLGIGLIGASVTTLLFGSPQSMPEAVSSLLAEISDFAAALQSS